MTIITSTGLYAEATACITTSTARDPATCWPMKNLRFERNTVSHNRGYRIRLEDTVDSQVAHYVVTDNVGYRVVVTNNADRSVVEPNDLRRNGAGPFRRAT